MSLQQNLGLGSYETAWVWLHKLRAAMVRPDRDRLLGPVEVDEAWIGGVEECLGGRQMNSKSMVAIAVEARERGLGRHTRPRLTLLLTAPPAEMLPEEDPGQTKMLDVQLVELVVAARALRVDPQVHSPLGDAIDVGRRCHVGAAMPAMLENDPVEDVLFRQGGNLEENADLLTAGGDHGAVRGHIAPGNGVLTTIWHPRRSIPPGRPNRRPAHVWQAASSAGSCPRSGGRRFAPAPGPLPQPESVVEIDGQACSLLPKLSRQLIIAGGGPAWPAFIRTSQSAFSSLVSRLC